VYVAQITVTPAKGKTEDTLDALNRWLSALRQNGQVNGREWAIAEHTTTFTLYALLPAENALIDSHGGTWVDRSYNDLLVTTDGPPEIVVLGKDPERATPCSCTSHSGFILYTTFSSLESPLRCADCFGPFPLYLLPKTTDGEYNDIFSWQSDYQACDQLQMNCTTGERFALREMGRYNSSLSRRGCAICFTIREATGCPIYYYLHRYYGRSHRQEAMRRCPNCTGEWLLAEPWHDIFDFRCDQCHLLSQKASFLSSEMRRR
jgi:predicted  nucleic acid-binding Zn ribbon protein